MLTGDDFLDEAFSDGLTVGKRETLQVLA